MSAVLDFIRYLDVFLLGVLVGCVAMSVREGK